MGFGGARRLGGWPFGGEQGGFLNEATEGAQVGQEVGDTDFLAAVGQATGAQASEAHAFEAGVAAFRQVAAAVAGFPGVGAVRHLAGQAHAAIGQGAADVDDLAVKMLRGLEGAVGCWLLGMMLAGLLATPLGAAALVVVAVGP